MSHTSRSYQFAAGQRPVMLSSEREAPGKRGLHPDIFIPLEGEQVIKNRERRGRRPIPIHPHPLVDRGQVIEHGVRPIDPAP